MADDFPRGNVCFRGVSISLNRIFIISETLGVLLESKKIQVAFTTLLDFRCGGFDTSIYTTVIMGSLCELVSNCSLRTIRAKITYCA